MQKVNLGYLSWNPLNWFKARPAETAVIRTAAGGTVTVPVKAVVPAGYIPPDITSPEYRAAVDFTQYAVLSEYAYIPGVGYKPAVVTPGRGAAPSSASPGTTTGSWWEPFLDTAQKMFSTYSNYQVSSSQSAKDAQAMKLQYDLELARIEAGKPPTVITIPGIKEPITVDWSAVIKTALLVGAIGLGIVLIRKK